VISKRLIYLLFLGLFSATALGQINLDQVEINYVCYKKPLHRVLEELSMQNQVNIVFSRNDIPEKLVSINARNYTLRQTLEYVLNGTGLIYDPVDFNIVIFREDVFLSEKYNISGYITDKLTGERLPYADIYLDDFSQGTTTNDYGYYSLNLSRGERKLICSYIGYHDQEISVNLRKETHLDIELVSEERTVIDEVLITADRMNANVIDFFKPGSVDIDELDRMVALGGEDDLMRLLYTKAGVLTGADGFGGMHVRGGNADQNQILLDGVPVYNAHHAIGLYSVFNGDIIQSSKLFKGDYPARYGGSASSVLDIRTRNGNKNKHQGNVSLGLFTVKAGLEGPLVPGKVSYLLSGRRTYADLWIKTLRDYLNTQQGSHGATDYYNFDINAKIHAAVNTGNNVFFSYYRGGDDFLNDYDLANPVEDAEGLVRKEIDRNRTKWGNQLMALKWTSNPTSRIFMDHSLVYSSFEMENFVFDWVGEQFGEFLENYRFSERMFLSDIRDYGFQSNLEFYRTPERTFRMGFKTTRHTFNPTVLVFDSETYRDIMNVEEVPGFGELKDSSHPVRSVGMENRAYLENEVEFRSKVRLNIGLHFANFLLEDEIYNFLEPRILFHAKLSDKTVFNLSGTMMSQFFHQLNNNGLGFPSQVWLPSTAVLKPQRSWQFAMGLNNRHNGNLITFFQAYYKSMENLIMADAGGYLDISQDSGWDYKVPSGHGYAYGIEAGFNWTSSKMYIEANYNLLYAKRKFADLNGGITFEHRFSRRHNVNLNFNYRINDNISFAANWTYGTGNPYTFPTQIASFVDDGVLVTKFVYESLNNHTIPDYHRLDFEFNFVNRFKWGKQKFALGAYNSYNRKNPFYITYDNRSSNLNEINSTNFNYVYVFPLIPVLHYSIDF
jgi:hypothetical protein